MAIVVAGMADQGVTLNASVCAEDVANGRPAPWMIFRAMEATQTSPPHSVIKIGDTLPDVVAGVRAGVWSIGVTDTGKIKVAPAKQVDEPIRGMDGEPLEDYIVEIYEGNDIVHSPETGKKGRFEASLTAGSEYTIDISMNGYFPKRVVARTTVPAEFSHSDSDWRHSSPAHCLNK